MIYITGDIHGDLSRFKDKRIKKLKKGDTLIVCGDFGFMETFFNRFLEEYEGKR